MKFFGLDITRSSDENDTLKSFVVPENKDTAIEISASGGAYGTYLDLSGQAKTEADLITRYRQMERDATVKKAVADIVNEAICISETEPTLSIDLNEVKLTNTVKRKIEQEFDECLRLLNFTNQGYDIFHRWYVDGRLKYHAVIDEKKPADGIQELRYIDSRKIRKVREIVRKPLAPGVDGTAKEIKNEYYIYSEKGFGSNKATQNGQIGMEQSNQDIKGVRIAKDSIIDVNSGLYTEDNALALSYLDSAVKPLNQLGSLEDASVIYRLSRAPERRIFYIDVGDLPKAKAEQYMRDMMVRHKNKLVYDAATGEIRDDRKFMCFALDTKIPLLDGRTATLQELIVEYQMGIKNWVYSCDPVTGEFVPGPVSWAGVTKENAEVVRVTFDNGKSVVCTPDHKFPAWDKGFIEAKDLAVGESIIPGYRRMKEITTGGVEYEQIFKNDTKTWEFTHREVAKWKDLNGIREEFIYKDPSQNKTVIHHVDYNRFNNAPNNLIMMGHKDHLDFHRENQNVDYSKEIYILVEQCAKKFMSAEDTLAYVNENTDLIEWRLLNSTKHIKNRSVEILKFTYKDLLRICQQHDFNGWRGYRSRYDIRHKEKNGRVLRSEYGTAKGSQEWKDLLSIAALKRERHSTSKTWKVTAPDGDQEIIENLSAYCRDHGLNRTSIKGNLGSKGYHAEQLRNHKVVSVEWLEDRIDTGCITVDLEETYHSNHTYLLDAGVYTKNTMLEDFWFPRREGGRGTEVTTLQGGQNLGEMDDVLYFQKKLNEALNVPASRLDSNSTYSFGRSGEITRDEVKFSKFITRLRNKFNGLFLGFLEKQLILKNVMTIEEWEDIKNVIRFDYLEDNHYQELKKIEILNGRLEALRNIQDYVGIYYSKDFVRKNVLYQTDTQIEDIQKEVEADKAMAPPPEADGDANDDGFQDQHGKPFGK